MANPSLFSYDSSSRFSSYMLTMHDITLPLGDVVLLTV